MKLLLTTLLVSLSASCDAFVPVFVPSQKVHSSTELEGILGRFRKKKEVEAPGTIRVGATIPEVDVEMLTVSDGEEGNDDNSGGVSVVPVSASEVVGSSGKSILLGMPGAFTPTCTEEHLPGFVAKANTFKKLGVEKIAVVTTNDKFVNEEWAKKQGLLSSSDEVITVLADGDGELVKAMGLVEDMGFGVGVRSQRFAIVIDDGKVSQIVIDEGMDSCEATSAASLLKALDPEGQVAEEEMDSATVGLVIAGIVAAAIAFSMGGGGEDHATTAATVVPAMKAAAPAAAKGGAQFGLLNSFK